MFNSFSRIYLCAGMKKTKPAVPDVSTEAKIKEAARKLFTQKGYAATRTRDIAAEAGINLALLNYYFRSKERLFDMIMAEHLMGLINGLAGMLNDPETTLEEKLHVFVNRYIDLLLEQPELPLFVLSEIKANPEALAKQMNLKVNLLESSFIKQFQEGIEAGKVAPVHPFHFILNLISMTVFPFIAGRLLKPMSNMSREQYNVLMEERRKLIPQWIKVMLFT